VHTGANIAHPEAVVLHPAESGYLQLLRSRAWVKLLRKETGLPDAMHLYYDELHQTSREHVAALELL
jgi:hypothetical protein